MRDLQDPTTSIRQNINNAITIEPLSGVPWSQPKVAGDRPRGGSRAWLHADSWSFFWHAG